MADSSYRDLRPTDYGITKSKDLDSSANRGTLVEMQMRNNSDNEVIDLAKYYQEQNREAQNNAKRRKLKWQLLVFALALIRFFLLGTLELSTQINYISSSTAVNELAASAATSVFSYLIFGQIVDNLPFESQRPLFCCIEMLMGIWFSVMGGIYIKDSWCNTEDCDDNNLLAVQF